MHSCLFPFLPITRASSHKVDISSVIETFEASQKPSLARTSDQAIALVGDGNRKQSENFINYLNNHRHRIVNYQYYQAEQICEGSFWRYRVSR